jgi:very-short-patch-repair endonuclease
MRKRYTAYRRRKEYRRLDPSERVLVAVMNNERDLRIAREQGWYRIPVRSAPAIMEFGRLALYQTKVFGDEGCAINYWAEVKGLQVVKRHELLPEEGDHPRAHEDYYKVEIGELHRLPRPIVSRRGRRIVFIPTTLAKFRQAREINDLFHESPLEDILWEAFKEEGLEAERQWYLRVGQVTYCLDFALFCAHGQIDVECDGDTWHSDPERIPEDNARDNALTSRGWSVLRFNSKQILEDLPTCLWMVRETVHRRGGLLTVEGELRWPATGPEGRKQYTLFRERGEEASFD